MSEILGKLEIWHFLTVVLAWFWLSIKIKNNKIKKLEVSVFKAEAKEELSRSSAKNIEALTARIAAQEELNENLKDYNDAYGVGLGDPKNRDSSE